MRSDQGRSLGPDFGGELAAVREELDKCMHCGFCMAVCPVYKTTKMEAGVARGKIAVAEAVMEGGLALDDPDVMDMMFNCLVCKSCMQNCPTKVDFARIVVALRAAIVRRNGLPWVKKAIFDALKSRTLFDRGMKAAARLSGLAFREAGQGAVSPRSPFAWLGKPIGIDGDRLFPAPAAKPLRDRLATTIPAETPQARVAFFTGCSLNYFYPETGEDVVEVLRRNNVEILIPKDQGCCGIAALVHGDVETTRALAKRNLDAMEGSGADYIVTACGSCGGTWQHDYREILRDDPIYGPKAEHWASRTHDISTFLAEVIDYRPPQGRVDAAVTYHDSCHLRKTMKVFREPRDLMKNIPGVSFKEMTKPDACCGSGGSYVLTHFETSTAIAKRKIDDITATGATTIATGCPACMMQLTDNLHRFERDRKVVHTISLLAQSYRAEGREGS